jgi:exodeoxyribonuclease VII small subunit
MMGEPQDSGGFNANYRILKGAADWLSGQKEPDIDQLVPRVEEAMKAYRACKERLDAAHEALGQYFDEGQAGAAGGETDGEPTF